MALADAQYIAINKALLAGQVSKSLVAKLYIGVAGEYEMAYGLISSIAGAQEVSTDLKKYIYDGVQFYKVSVCVLYASTMLLTCIQTGYGEKVSCHGCQRQPASILSTLFY